LSLDRKKILLVEDDPDHVRLIRQSFVAAGAEAGLCVVGSTEEARRLIASDPPDLAIIDLVPQGGSGGFDLLQQERGPSGFPVIILTTRGGEKSAVAAMKAGAQDFLIKNEVNLKALPQIVEGVLREWKQLRLTREAEAELRESKARYKRLYQQFQTLLDGIPDVLVLLDAHLNIEWINRAGKERFDTGGSIPGQSPCCYEVFHHNAAPCSSCPVLASFASGKVEESLVTTSAGRIWGIKAFPLKGPDGRVQNVIELASEVTDKIKSRAEGVRASQLATLGELAAGVAHEINNPVNSIINYGQLLLDRHQSGDRDHDVAREIIDEGLRIARTVKSLLSFAQNRGEPKRPVRLEEIVAACLDLSNSQLRKEGIAVDVDLPPELPAVLVENQPIQQVLLNLISNSRYALNEKYPPHHPGKRLLLKGRLLETPRPMVRLEVTDLGTGIPRHLLGRVMEHYFTTKPPDRGNGLGLSMSREVVSKQGGELRIDSVEGESTTVTLDLPVAAGREKG
jgi:signal transduction histidine kinase/DNA-binding NarL/FixJ family response regulator